MRLWDLRANDAISVKKKFIGHKGWVSSVKWSRENASQFTTCSFDGTVKVWDIRSSSPLHTLKLSHETEKLLALDARDNLIFTGGEDKKVLVFNH